MGCYNLRGFASHISITKGTPVVVILGATLSEKENLNRYYTCGYKLPLSLAIYGTYDEYGNIEVNRNKNTEHIEWLEKNVGNINDIIEAISECHSYNRTIKEAMNSTNEYHPSTSVRYVYKNLIEKCRIYENYMPFVVMELEEFYTKAVKSIGIIKDYNDSNDIDEEIKEYQENPSKTFNFYHLQIFGSNNSNSLKLYEKDIVFYCSQKNYIKELQSFIYYLISNAIEFNTPIQYRQDNGYEKNINYHELCLEILTKLNKEKEIY